MKSPLRPSTLHQLVWLVILATLAGCSGRFQEVGRVPLDAVPPPERILDPTLDTSRAVLLQAVDRSINYLRKSNSVKVPSGLPLELRPERVLYSLEKFREIVRTEVTAEGIENRVRREFLFFQPRKEVLFTAYCEPELQASRTRSVEFPYPIFGAPSSFSTWPKPHPTRVHLEGWDGKGGLLSGDELFYLRNRFDVLFTQIQGSALLQVDGQPIRVGFATATEYPFRSIAQALIRDGVITRSQAGADQLRSLFTQRPDLLDRYAALNNRVIMFRQLSTDGPVGSLGEVVTAERSLAADRKVFPAGGLTVVRGDFPFPSKIGSGVESHFMLDQDTGSAITGPARVDLFFGSGNDACSRAGRVKNSGELYYLAFKQPSPTIPHLQPTQP